MTNFCTSASLAARKLACRNPRTSSLRFCRRGKGFVTSHWPTEKVPPARPAAEARADDLADRSHDAPCGAEKLPPAYSKRSGTKLPHSTRSGPAWSPASSAAPLREVLEGGSTITMDGRLTSRPMTLQEVEFDGSLWFFAERGSTPVEHITASPEVNVGAGSGGTWISLTGDAAVVEDAAKKRELWNSAVEAWFPQGPDDDSVVLIKVDADSAEYWDAPAAASRRRSAS